MNFFKFFCLVFCISGLEASQLLEDDKDLCETSGNIDTKEINRFLCQNDTCDGFQKAALATDLILSNDPNDVQDGLKLFNSVYDKSILYDQIVELENDFNYSPLYCIFFLCKDPKTITEINTMMDSYMKRRLYEHRHHFGDNWLLNLSVAKIEELLINFRFIILRLLHLQLFNYENIQKWTNEDIDKFSFLEGTWTYFVPDKLKEISADALRKIIFIKLGVIVEMFKIYSEYIDIPTIIIQIDLYYSSLDLDENQGITLQARSISEDMFLIVPNDESIANEVSCVIEELCEKVNKKNSEEDFEANISNIEDGFDKLIEELDADEKRLDAILESLERFERIIQEEKHSISASSNRNDKDEGIFRCAQEILGRQNQEETEIISEAPANAPEELKLREKPSKPEELLSSSDEEKDTAYSKKLCLRAMKAIEENKILRHPIMKNQAEDEVSHSNGSEWSEENVGKIEISVEEVKNAENEESKSESINNIKSDIKVETKVEAKVEKVEPIVENVVSDDLTSVESASEATNESSSEDDESIKYDLKAKNPKPIEKKVNFESRSHEFDSTAASSLKETSKNSSNNNNNYEDEGNITNKTSTSNSTNKNMSNDRRTADIIFYISLVLLLALTLGISWMVYLNWGVLSGSIVLE